jgi:prevent-host-death family protein
VSNVWKLEDAKARFSEVVRKAQSEGAQRVTVRGREAVAVISINELERLQGRQKPRMPFVEFMESLAFEGHDGLVLERNKDPGRIPEL